MNEKQKKVIIKFGVSLILVICLGLSVSTLAFIVLEKDFVSQIEFLKSIFTWLFANFGSITIGIVIKVFINKLQLKRTKELFEVAGVKTIPLDRKSLKMAKNELQNTFKYKGFFFQREDGKITIYYDKGISQERMHPEMQEAFGAYLEKIRKEK